MDHEDCKPTVISSYREAINPPYLIRTEKASTTKEVEWDWDLCCKAFPHVSNNDEDLSWEKNPLAV